MARIKKKSELKKKTKLRIKKKRVVYTEAEKQRRMRIQVSLWAYAYENRGTIIVSDAVFDETCQEVYDNLDVDTDRPDLDEWFRTGGFHPDTGSWIGKHPEIHLIEALYERLKAGAEIHGRTWYGDTPDPYTSYSKRPIGVSPQDLFIFWLTVNHK